MNQVFTVSRFFDRDFEAMAIYLSKFRFRIPRPRIMLKIHIFSLLHEILRILNLTVVFIESPCSIEG